MPQSTLATIPNSSPIRTLILASYPLTRAGLAALLGGVSDIVIVGQAAVTADLISLVPETTPLVLIIDLPDPASELLETLNSTLTTLPPLACLLLSTGPGAATLSRALQSGLHGFLPRDSSAESLIAAVRAVAAGLIVVHPTMIEAFGEEEPAQTATAMQLPDAEPLTPRERDVLQLLATGLTNREIARQLAVSENTAKFHVSSILMKLDAASRAEAVALAARRGLLLL